MIRLEDHLVEERVLDLTSRTRDAALLEIVESLREAPEIEDKERLLEALIEREDIGSTGIGVGVAVPHAKIPQVTDFVIAYGRSREGIEWGSVDARAVHHVVLIAGPADRQHRYLQLLASVMLELKKPELRLALEQAPDVAAMTRTLLGS